MKIAILSGKGGTGKTLIATNLAYVSQPSRYIDADVEEPNGFLALQPRIEERTQVFIKIPAVDQSKCNGCRQCIDVCHYHALAYTGERLVVFPTLCHSCGACSYFCPTGALSETIHSIGYTEQGVFEGVTAYSGTLRPGQLSGIPIIEALFEHVKDDEGLIWIDSPPGVACQVIACVETADFCLLVAEDSLFGLDNLIMAHQLTKTLHKRAGVVINKCYAPISVCDSYCVSEGLPIIARIMFDIRLAKQGAEGRLIATSNGEYLELLKNLFKKVMEEVSNAPIACP